MTNLVEDLLQKCDDYMYNRSAVDGVGFCEWKLLREKAREFGQLRVKIHISGNMSWFTKQDIETLDEALLLRNKIEW